MEWICYRGAEIDKKKQSDELAHHGILGQKWGVRRYQNYDGSLTNAGRKRYGDSDERTLKGPDSLYTHREQKNNAKNIKQYNQKNKADPTLLRAMEDNHPEECKEYASAEEARLKMLVKKGPDAIIEYAKTIDEPLYEALTQDWDQSDAEYWLQKNDSSYKKLADSADAAGKKLQDSFNKELSNYIGTNKVAGTYIQLNNIANEILSDYNGKSKDSYYYDDFSEAYEKRIKAERNKLLEEWRNKNL